MYFPHEGLARTLHTERGAHGTGRPARRATAHHHHLRPEEAWLRLEDRLIPGGARARARLAAAERHFREAYRGFPLGEVIPEGYFRRPRVAHALTLWAARGRRLDRRLLAREWRRASGGGDAAGFHEALTHFLSRV